MRTHAVLGHDRLVAMGEEDPLVLAITRSHHERVDGSGYPDGLRGEKIPTLVRAFAVVDTFDALTSYRPYRQEVGHAAAKAALRELGERAGEWYDESAVRALGAMFDAGELLWIMEHHNRTEPSGFPRLPDEPGGA
jgi:HD-GYP domain-containing protein (c-di-GMP phosphodiesterase class II)